MLQENPISKLKIEHFLIAYVFIYVIIKIIFIISGPDLFSEEAQYWLWSQHLDWSYYSKPPLIAWVNFGTQKLFGHSDLVIRFNALGFGLATLFVLYFVAIEMFNNKRIAVIAVIILSVSPYFILASTFFTTDSILIFFWMLTFYLFLKGLKTKSIIIWLAIGVSFGFGCLSKYTMVFFALVLLVPFLWKIDQTIYMKQLAVMTIVVLVLNAPVIWWNYVQGWVTVKHVNNLASGGKNTIDLVRSIKFAGEFVGGVLLINSPFFAFLFFKGLTRWRTYVDNASKPKLLLLTLPVAGTLAFFLIISLFKSVEVNWPSMVYLTLPLVIAYFVVTNEYTRSLVVGTTLTATLLLLLLFPRLQDKMGMFSILPIEFDSMKRMAGWKELSEKVKELQNKYHEKECVFVFSPSYHVASAVSFYMNTSEVFCIEINRRKNQFDLWKNINQYKNTNCYGIYVSDQPIPSEIKNVFGNEIDLVRLPIQYRGRIVRNFNIYVLKNFSGWHNSAPPTY